MLDGSVRNAVLKALRRIAERFFNGDMSKLAKAFESEKYSSHLWQSFKRELAELLVDHIVKEFGYSTVEEIYYADLHGGKPANIGCHGGKDIDLIVKVSKTSNLNVEEIEKRMENSILKVLNEILGINVKEAVGIPNIIELHVIEGDSGKSSYMGYIVNSIYSRGSPLYMFVYDFI